VYLRTNHTAPTFFSECEEQKNQNQNKNLRAMKENDFEYLLEICSNFNVDLDTAIKFCANQGIFIRQSNQLFDIVFTYIMHLAQQKLHLEEVEFQIDNNYMMANLFVKGLDGNFESVSCFKEIYALFNQ